MSGHEVSYSVGLRRPAKTVKVRVLAENPEQAVERAIRKRRGLQAEWVEDIGEGDEFCEACGVALLSGRDEGRSVDEDGTQVCTECCAKAAEEEGK